LGFWYDGQDKGKHLATLYLEDISDFIVECDANFGFSRYAERLGGHQFFDELYGSADQPIDSVLLSTLKEKSKRFNLLVLISVPFREFILLFDLQWVKKHHPKLKFLWAVSEYRTSSLSDARVLNFRLHYFR
jgi:hypothetical protein